MIAEQYRTSNIKEFASRCGLTSDGLIAIIEGIPELNFNKVRKWKPYYRTLVPADLEKLAYLIPKSTAS